jgi:DNA-binding NarL/FixJ family response regulator
MSLFVAAPSTNDPGNERGPTTSVLVVDDHVVFGQLIERALSQEGDLACVGTASSLAEARRAFAALRPDVVLMDVRLPDGDGIDAAAELVEEDPDVRVVVLSAFIDAALMRRANQAGATALLAKDGDLEELLQAIRSSEAGSLAVNPRLLHQLVRESVRATPLPDLTQREREVLRMLAEGSDLTLIAREMSISVHTCRGHVKNVLAKLGVHSQLQAVVVALRSGLIEPSMEHA